MKRKVLNKFFFLIIILVILHLSSPCLAQNSVTPFEITLTSSKASYERGESIYLRATFFATGDRPVDIVSSSQGSLSIRKLTRNGESIEPLGPIITEGYQPLKSALLNSRFHKTLQPGETYSVVYPVQLEEFGNQTIAPLVESVTINNEGKEVRYDFILDSPGTYRISVQYDWYINPSDINSEKIVVISKELEFKIQ